MATVGAHRGTASSVASAQPPASSDPRDHALNLKVMRLSKPTFQLHAPVLIDKLDGIGGVTEIDISGKHVATSFGLTDFFALPTSFGKIYLGEIFRCYICMLNSVHLDVYHIILKVELQTASNRFTLLDLSDRALTKLSPEENVDFVVQHEVAEKGVHILVCSATYTMPDGSTKNFRKFFKFQVLDPVSIKHRTHTLPNAVFVETQLKNEMQIPLFLDTVCFRPSELFSCIDISSSIGPAATTLAASISDLTVIKPGEVRQFLHRLEASSPTALMKTEGTLGEFEIIWRSAMGERGRVTAPPIHLKSLATSDVELKLIGLPSQIVLERPCGVTCEITNRSRKPLSLKLFLLRDRMGGIVVNGVSGKALGQVPPNSSKTLPLSLFPLKPGVQKISGIQIVDLQTGRKFDFDNLGHCMVMLKVERSA